MILHTEEAAEIINKAFDRANNFFRARDFQNAKCLYEQILRVEQVDSSKQADAIHMLALVEYEMGNRGRSLDLLTEAQRRGCDSWQFYNSLGTVKSAFNQTKDAVKFFKRSLQINPNASGVHVNLGIEFSKQQRFKRAEQSFLQATKIDASNPYIWFNLGNIYAQQAKTKKAITSYKTAISINSAFLPARWNLSHALLLMGDFNEGWREYECRWKLFDIFQHIRRKFDKSTLWTGQPLEGKSITIYSEQGSGDAIQFIRYARLLKEMGAYVVVEWPKNQSRGDLSKLLKTVVGVDEVANKCIPDTDFHQSMISLPHIFGFNLYWSKPYIEVSSRKRSGKKLRVGLAWKGNPIHFNDHNRSLDLSLLQPVLSLRGIDFYNLQREPMDGIINTKLADFNDTARLVADMDQIVSVDTAVAHLAAAMGKPTNILLPFVPDWRWMLKKETTPWYGTARLLRQNRIGDWSEPIEQIRTILADTR